MTLTNEFRQDRLLHSGRLAAHGETDTLEALYQSGRKNEISDAQRGSNALAEIPDVDDSFVLIDALQARCRSAAITVFAEVVILEDPSIA